MTARTFPAILALAISAAHAAPVTIYSAPADLVQSDSRKARTNPPVSLFPDEWWQSIVVLNLPNRIVIGYNCGASVYSLPTAYGQTTAQGYQGQCTHVTGEGQPFNGVSYNTSYHNLTVRLVDASVPGYTWRGCHFDLPTRTAAPTYPTGFLNALYFTCVEESQIPAGVE